MEFKILNNTIHTFSFRNRLKILFGAKLINESVITVDKEVGIIRSKTIGRIPNFFHKKSKEGYGEIVLQEKTPKFKFGDKVIIIGERTSPFLIGSIATILDHTDNGNGWFYCRIDKGNYGLIHEDDLELTSKILKGEVDV